MIKHLITITVIIILISLCMFLPFLPGNYDELAPTLSFMAQLLCYAGLILVPIGIVWLIYETIKYRKNGIASSNATYYFGVVSLIALCIVISLVSITVFVSDNRSLGIITIIAFIYFSIKLIAGIKKWKNAAMHGFNAAPLYLICIPLVTLLIRYTFISHAVEYSRSVAIQNSQQLINDIEIYYKNNGHYPASMLSLRNDYKTSIAGVEQYHYEPNGKAYNLYFEQISGDIATKEIVMYNKLGEHQMTSHDQDLLLLSANELNQQRGYIAVHNLPDVHWKYFWFD